MIFLPAIAVFFLDRLTKILAVGNMAAGSSIDVLPRIFGFTLVLNDGTAFGLFKGYQAAILAFSCLAIIVITTYALTHKTRPMESMALGMILGGALGNLFDRVLLGHVIDFLDFKVWPVFNVADSAITVGTFVLIMVLCTRSS